MSGSAGSGSGLPWERATRMRRRTIIFPRNDNEGNSLEAENRAIRDELGSLAPGYTENPTSRGVWYHPETGKRYEDDVNEVWFTTPSDKDEEIKKRLPAWRDSLRQEALYSDWQEVNLDLV